MIYPDTTLAEKISILKTAIDKAEALIIGAGSGLSRTRYAGEAAGLACDNAETFSALFPGCHDRYGLQSIGEADFYPFPTQQVSCAPQYPGCSVSISP
jgi:hypothetical protein